MLKAAKDFIAVYGININKLATCSQELSLFALTLVPM